MHKLTAPVLDITGQTVTELNYTLRPTTNKQARLQGRLIAEPELDLSQFEINALVDWIQIKATVVKPTQFQWLQFAAREHLGRTPYIKTLDPQPGNTGNIFRIRIQEADFGKIRTILEEIDQKFLLNQNPEVEQMEVSLDFWLKIQDEKKRASMFAALWRHLMIPADTVLLPDHLPRAVFGSKPNTHYILHQNKDEPVPNLESRLTVGKDSSPPFGSTVYFGKRDSPAAMWRLMDKTRDEQNNAAGTFRPLPEAERRIRLEVTLGREEISRLGVKTIDDLKTMSFMRLAGAYFKFRLPSFPDPDLNAGSRHGMELRRLTMRTTKFVGSGIVGLTAYDDAWTAQHKSVRRDIRSRLAKIGRKMDAPRRQGDGTSGTDVAWAGMNGRVVQALRHLGKRVRRQFS